VAPASQLTGWLFTDWTRICKHSGRKEILLLKGVGRWGSKSLVILKEQKLKGKK
jgi:hypothetical protein